jgi:uncharacterized membrane protein
MAESRRETFSGPLPPPELFQRYNEIIPGAAERILLQSEEQAKHRQQLENKVVNGQILISKLGQIFALLIAFACIGGAVLCAKYGQPVPATALGGASLVGSISAFLTGKKQKENSFVQQQTGS